MQEAISKCLLQSTNCSKGPHGPIGSWDVSGVTDMEGLFFTPNWDPIPQSADSEKFNGDISQWDVSRVTNMANMFCDGSSFQCDLSRWDVSRVINMEGMFHYASSFNSDLSK